MNLRRKSFGSLVALLFLGIAPPLPASTKPVDVSRTNGVVRLRTSDLRSAYLIRSGQVEYDTHDLSPVGLRRQLQRHFDTVVALLLLNTSHSVELALVRLEAQQRATWSAAERSVWRERLLASRQVQIVRLIEYRNRGRFPQNEGYAAAAVPIFVDAHDTACAVGHLMRLAGREREVAGIERENNLVYVPDAISGPIIAWTLTSGITLEEAALIQPSYGAVLLPKPDDIAEVVGDDASFEFENLRYSNFKLFTSDHPEPPAVNIPVSHTACSWYGCGLTFPVIYVVDPALDITQLPHTPFEIGSNSLRALEQNPTLLTSFPRVVVQFDVEVTAPNLRIAELPYAGSLLTNSYFDGNQFRLFVNDSQDRLWIDQVRNPAPPCEGIFCGIWLWDESAPETQLELTDVASELSPPTGSFAPTPRLTVVTEMYFPPEQAFRGQFINFSLVAVPEPATALLIVLAIGFYVLSWPRARRG